MARITVGKLLRYHRKQKNLTQQQLANLLNVDFQYISKIENGKVNMSLDYLGDILQQLQIAHHDFFIIPPTL